MKRITRLDISNSQLDSLTALPSFVTFLTADSIIPDFVCLMQNESQSSHFLTAFILWKAAKRVAGEGPSALPYLTYPGLRKPKVDRVAIRAPSGGFISSIVVKPFEFETVDTLLGYYCLSFSCFFKLFLSGQSSSPLSL